MPKKRVYELSKELGVANKDVLDAGKQLGISLKSHASSLTDEQAASIRERFAPLPGKSDSEEVEEEKEIVRVFISKSGQEVVEKRRGNIVVRRKKKQPDIPPEISKEKELKKEESKPEGVPEGAEGKPSLSIQSEAQTGTGKEVLETTVLDPTKLEAEAKKESIPVGVEAEPELPDTPSVKDVPTKVEPSWGEKKEAVKKKKTTGKPTAELHELVDEEVLDELKKAFKTKLPTRRQEFLVSDRRPRPRQSRDQGARSQQRARNGGSSPVESVSPFVSHGTRPDKKAIKIGENINVAELAKRMGIKVKGIIKQLMVLGTPATINQTIDHLTATLVAEELGYEVIVDFFEEKELLAEQDAGHVGEEVPRPPVVTVMGHVDHGKTSLLDAIRQTDVAAKEAGGITQHIGAYAVDIDGRKIVFIDTPGHEAFTAMRARGAGVTDLVVLVIAADDGVMPQTIEAVNHAKAANVPILVALNKMDKPDANKESVIRQLSEIELLPEEWGGDTMLCEVSAKNKTGIDELLEMVLLQADVLELRADPIKLARGVVIEASLDKGRGPVSTVIVQQGTLKIGDYVLAGTSCGRVRALIDDHDNRIQEAPPSTPAQVLGLSGVPDAGVEFNVVKDEKLAKEIVQRRNHKLREKLSIPVVPVTPQNLFDSLKKEESKELALIIKADTGGSAEVLRDSVNKLSTEKCTVNVIHAGVGAISETDISLAVASSALVVGFNVRPDHKTQKMAERENVDIELHKVIYNAVDRIRSSMEGLLEPIIKERILGHADVRDKFHISKVGTIAGCYVTDGNIARGMNARIVRDGVTVYEGKLNSLKRFKEDAKEVQSGYECGIGIENFNDIKIGDTIELFTFDEIRQEL